MLVFRDNFYRKSIRKGVATDERRKALGNYEGGSKVSDPDGLSRKETNRYPGQPSLRTELYSHLLEELSRKLRNFPNKTPKEVEDRLTKEQRHTNLG